MIYQQQTQLEDFKNNSLDNLNYSLSLCGRFATKNFYCKKCEREGKPALLKISHKIFHCEIRYCNKPECLVSRFVNQMNTFEEIKAFHGWNNLHHFVISFPLIDYYDFKENFTKYKKRSEYVMNRYFEKLRLPYYSFGRGKKRVFIMKSPEEIIKLKAIRVLDFSFTSGDKVLMHYHFGAVPTGSKTQIKRSLGFMQKVRICMLEDMKQKTSFILNSFGLADKVATMSYLSIRASGMYKYERTQDFRYEIQKQPLLKSINEGKYVFLSSILTKEEYLKSFYGKSHYTTIGDFYYCVYCKKDFPLNKVFVDLFDGKKKHDKYCPYCMGINPEQQLKAIFQSSIIRDVINLSCPIHGKLERKDIRIEIIFDELIKSVLPPNLIIENLNYSYEIVSRTNFQEDFFNLCN
jgi:hypothetical protein